MEPRSFVNNPDLAVPFDRLRFGAETLALRSPEFGGLTGTLGGDDWQLTVNGAASYGNPFACRLQGVGKIDGEQWVYDYTGYLTPAWPHGIYQVPAITGPVIRTVPHGSAPAGAVASFIAVRA
jgi:hypothetical protein